jgi:hypothetical protein
MGGGWDATYPPLGGRLSPYQLESDFGARRATGVSDRRRSGVRAFAPRPSTTRSQTLTNLVNVAIGLAARATAPEVAVVLRLGDGEVAAETESLLHLVRIFDAHRIAAEALADSLRGNL